MFVPAFIRGAQPDLSSFILLPSSSPAFRLLGPQLCSRFIIYLLISVLYSRSVSMWWKDRIRRVMRKKHFFFLHLLFSVFEPKWHSVFLLKKGQMAGWLVTKWKLYTFQKYYSFKLNDVDFRDLTEKQHISEIEPNFYSNYPPARNFYMSSNRNKKN